MSQVNAVLVVLERNDSSELLLFRSVTKFAVMEDNKVLASAIKITGSGGGLKAGELLRESKSLNFISLKSVNKDDAPKLVRDLESLIGKLDDAVAGLYREGAGP